MKQPLPTELSNEYVRLLPLQLHHSEAFYNAGRDPSLWRWVKPNLCQDLATATRWVEQSVARTEAGEHVAFVIIDRATEQVIGSTRYCSIDVTNGGIEIGFTFIAPEFQRSHINSNAKYLLLKHAFETLGAIRVQFITHESNQKSRNAISRLGAKLEGVVRNQRLFDCGGRRNTALFSIIDDEWPSVKRNLENNRITTADNTPSLCVSDAARTLIEQQPLAQIMIQSNDSLSEQIIYAPLYLDSDGAGLTGHVAKNNKLNWLLENSPSVVVVFHGEDGYVSPQWHEGQKVPTWNYQRLHLRGKFSFVDGLSDEQKFAQLAEQVAIHEGDEWRIDQQPQSLMTQMSNNIKHFRIALTHQSLIAKLSQKKPQAVRDAIAQGFEQQGKVQLALLHRDKV